MYDEIQKIIAPNLISSFEYTKIEDLLKTYTEEEIINAYKKVGYKPIEYIKKVLQNTPKKPDWLDKEIINEPIDKETEELYEDFNNFINEFRGYGERIDNEGHTH